MKLQVTRRNVMFSGVATALAASIGIAAKKGSALPLLLTDDDKERFLREHDLILGEIIFDESDIPPRSDVKLASPAELGIVLQDGKHQLIPRFYVNKKGEAIPRKAEDKRAMPTRDAALMHLDGCAKIVAHFNNLNRNSPYESIGPIVTHIYLLRNAFDPKAIAVCTTPCPVVAKEAIGGQRI